MPRPKRRTAAAKQASPDPEPRGRTRSTRRSTAAAEAAAATEASSSTETGRRATTPQRRDTSGLDLGDSVFGDLDDSFGVDEGESGIEGIIMPPSSAGSGRSLYYGTTAGPGSSHTKPRSRSRQSSIIRPASRSGVAATPLMSSSLNLGAFRRRAREPSILGTARKADETATNTRQSTPEPDDDDDDDEDQVPEAESTPVNNRRRSTRSSMRQQPEAEAEAEAEPELPRLNLRKRKSDAAEGSTRPEKASRTEPADDDSDSELSDLPSPGGLSPRLPERPVTPGRDDDSQDYAAPPASSDVDGDDMDWWPDIHGLARRRRRPSVVTPVRPTAAAAGDDDMASNVSSPPSLTHSPNHERPARRGGRARRAAPPSSPPPLTTADLANLLPKRKTVQEKEMAKERRRKAAAQKEQGEYDTAGLAEDQDELSIVGNRKRTVPAPAAAEGNTRATRSSSRRNNKTYSRRLSDKENEQSGDEDGDEDDEAERSMFQPLADDTFDDTAGEARKALLSAEELKKAASKFKEVDRWELSFEEAEEQEEVLGAEAR